MHAIWVWEEDLGEGSEERGREEGERPARPGVSSDACGSREGRKTVGWDELQTSEQF